MLIEKYWTRFGGFVATKVFCLCYAWVHLKSILIQTATSPFHPEGAGRSRFHFEGKTEIILPPSSEMDGFHFEGNMKSILTPPPQSKMDRFHTLKIESVLPSKWNLSILQSGGYSILRVKWIPFWGVKMESILLPRVKGNFWNNFSP